MRRILLAIALLAPSTAWADLSQAAKYFQQISANSPEYPYAKFHEGVVRSEQDKLGASVRAFAEVVRITGDPRRAASRRERHQLERVHAFVRVQLGEAPSDHEPPPAHPASPAIRSVLRTDFDAQLKASTDEAH